MAIHADPARARAAAVKIVAHLRELGHTAFFAGGCVRDELLGLHPTDFDIATSARPDQVARTFRGTRLVGQAFGVVLVPGDDAQAMIEVATFRADGPYSDRRRPDSIAFADDVADAHRRDFTINALFLDPLAPATTVGESSIAGRVIDHVGGLSDLQSRIIRAVGNPAQRLCEDHLRALRAARFAARLGFALDPATADAIRAHARDLAGVSRERIGEEVRRMLVHPRRAQAISLLRDLDLLAPVLDLPSTPPMRPMTCLSSLQGPDPAPPTEPFIVALAAWIVDSFAPAEPWPTAAISATVGRIRAALCLSNDVRDGVVAVISVLVSLESEWEASGMAGRKRRASSRGFSGALALLNARNPNLAKRVSEEINRLSVCFGGLSPEPLVTGDLLVDQGLAPGPRFKRLLDLVYDAQLEGRITTVSEGLELARGLSV
ncbi:MAG: CCA tRNA nucleotidyltransferase [Phycisphaerales bacterium]